MYPEKVACYSKQSEICSYNICFKIGTTSFYGYYVSVVLWIVLDFINNWCVLTSFDTDSQRIALCYREKQQGRV